MINKLYSLKAKQHSRTLTGLCQRFVVLALVLILAGCPLQSSKPITYDETKGAEYYLNLARTSSGSEQINWQLLGIRALLTENKLTLAQQELAQIDKSLNSEQQKEFILNSAELAAKLHRTYDLSELDVNQLTEAQKIRYYKIRIALAALQSDVGAQIRDYIALEQLGTEKQRHKTINDTWQFLTTLTATQINQIMIYADETTLQGWIDLLYSYRNSGGAYEGELNTPEEQEHYLKLKNAINEWQIQYSSNPAAIYLPRNIYGEDRRLPEDDNRLSVALLLPLSGPSKIFGETIQLGYLDASKLYPNESMQNIKVYDTNSSPLELLIQQAEQDGANLLVGPLLKQDVALIEKLAPSLPVLALNRAETENNPLQPTVMSNAICYFSLSPEDEAREAASHIYNRRKTMPLVIAPAGDLGERVAKAFAEQWTMLNSENNAHVQYFASATQLSASMNKGVGLKVEGDLILSLPLVDDERLLADDSGNGAEDTLNNDPLQSLLNSVNPSPSESEIADLSTTEVEEEPEFDAIYVYANKEELTLIKSMLDMKQEEVKVVDNEDSTDETVEKTQEKPVPPVYASSRSNSANVTADYRYDMERVEFSEIPLIVNKSQMMKNLPSYIQSDYSLVRLYGMGIDAWRLANRFEQLKPYSINIMNGMTGKMSVAENCEITREMVWQQYRRGEVRLVR